MQCPRCSSEKLQRDITSGSAFGRLAGRRQLFCQTCGHSFSAFDPMGKIGREPAKGDLKSTNRRRSPRFRVHLPAAISLIKKASTGGTGTYSDASQGHCEMINEHGMELSLVGSKFPEAELTRIGGYMLVRLRLPDSTLRAVVSIVNHKRIGENQKRKWFLGVKFQQMSDEDKEQLGKYLEFRERNQPILDTE